MLKTKYTYSGENCPDDLLDTYLNNVNHICLDILYRRGFRTTDGMRSFLFPDIRNAIGPLKCLDIGKAITLLTKAVKEKLPVVVYRDYDVDGISAGAIAVEALRNLGVPTQHYANDREIDGFGICKNGIDQILHLWPDTRIILTVDNGITGNEAISYAASRGLEVIVTDHHIPGPEIPKDAVAVIDLKREGESYPFYELCGAGVIFKVMLDLYRALNKDPSVVLNELDIVALATVADVVPLVGENRALVHEGMKLIESAQRPFFRSMAKVYNVQDVSAHYTIAFQYAPALNSLSRMGEDTGMAVEALLSQDTNYTDVQAAGFKIVNEERKKTTKEQLELAESMIDDSDLPPAIILYSSSFTEGIVGILAGHLKTKYNRPCIVLSHSPNGSLKGSGRSIDAVPLKEVLDQLSDTLLAYGGHAKAAGLSLSEDSLEVFRKKFCAITEKLTEGKDLRPVQEIAAVLNEHTLTEQLVRDLRILEPYGEGFPEPVFGLIDDVTNVRYMGTKEQHVKMTSEDARVAVIGWNIADTFRHLKKLPRKFVGKPALNSWNGNVSVQFIMAQE